MTTECARESEIVDAIAAGEWPHAAPASLQTHATSCPVCGDLALAASALHDDAVAATESPIALPSAGQVWWRAELRARQERALLAQRPILAVQVVAVVVVLAAAVTGLRGFAPDAWAWLMTSIGAARMSSFSFATMDTWTLALVLSLGLWLVLGPIAIVMVLRADRQGGR